MRSPCSLIPIKRERQDRASVLITKTAFQATGPKSASSSRIHLGFPPSWIKRTIAPRSETGTRRVKTARGGKEADEVRRNCAETNTNLEELTSRPVKAQVTSRDDVIVESEGLRQDKSPRSFDQSGSSYQSRRKHFIGTDRDCSDGKMTSHCQ